MSSQEELANLGFEDGEELDGSPLGWRGGGQGYELGVDHEVSRVSGASGRVRSVDLPGRQGFWTLAQCFAATAFRGTVVRYSGFLKTADVRGWAGLWMRVDDGDGETLRFDNMADPVDRSIAGSTDWAQYEIVLDIPPEAKTICLGFLLAGTGAVWGDDLEFGVLDGPISDEVRAGIHLRWATEKPANLGFEDGAEQDRRPSRWRGGGKGYELAVDHLVSY